MTIVGRGLRDHDLQQLMCGFALFDAQGHLIRDANSVTLERDDLLGVVRQHPNVP